MPSVDTRICMHMHPSPRSTNQPLYPTRCRAWTPVYACTCTPVHARRTSLCTQPDAERGHLYPRLCMSTLNPSASVPNMMPSVDTLCRIALTAVTFLFGLFGRQVVASDGGSGGTASGGAPSGGASSGSDAAASGTVRLHECAALHPMHRETCARSRTCGTTKHDSLDLRNTPA